MFFDSCGDYILSFRSKRLRIAFRCGLCCIGMLTISGRAGAADFDTLFAGANDFGDAGLLQTPTARMRQDGEFGAGVSIDHPYNQADFYLQPLPWLEAAVRYTSVINIQLDGAESYKDKSADLKFRLLNEGRYWPEVSLGLQDIGGTGLFSSEYFVGSYHWYDLDFSFGLAWGRLGSGGHIHNPLSIFSPSHFDINRYNTGDGLSTPGNAGFGRLFTGETIGPFGGVEWLTPVKGLALRLEYDGNDYQHEALNDNQPQNLRLNFGVDYRGLRNVDMGLGYERGNTLLLRVAFYTNFQSLWRTAKTADPAPPPLAPAADGAASAPASEAAAAAATPSPRLSGTAEAEPLPAPPSSPMTPTNLPQAAASSADSALKITQQRDQFVLDLKAALHQQGYEFIALDFDQDGIGLHLWLNQNRYRNSAKAVGRAARVLAATAPAGISRFTLVFIEAGMENFRAEVDRHQFATAAPQNDLDTALAAITLYGPGKGFSGANYIDDTRVPKFSWDTGPAFRQSVGSPGAFYTAQLYWQVNASLALFDGFSINAGTGFNIYNNFNNIDVQPNSSLPHVRSDIVEYLQQGSNGIMDLAANYVWSPRPDWYHRVTAGIFEQMYGGVATELLYRPYGRSWAVAADINRVRQRGFDEMFDFLPYTVTTGRVTLYYKPDLYNLMVKLSAGRYLAGDHGGTLDISREFDSGIIAGVFATKTNVSAAQFGEGSFDKGIYIVLPLDLFFASSTRRAAGFVFRPLTRDGGQMVYDGPELYYTVQQGAPDQFNRDAPELLR
jgi:hypothetical protein